MVDANLGKHCVVFNLGLAQRRTIVGEYNQLPCITKPKKSQNLELKINTILQIHKFYKQDNKLEGKKEPLELRRERRTVL